MTYDCQTSGYTVIIPAGCLGKTPIELQCKSPLESVYYQFSLQNRLQPSEMITAVTVEPSENANVVVDHIGIANQYFKCRISGGNLNTYAGIRFLITTNNSSVREFDVTLPILPAGVIKDGATGQSYVIGDKGAKGDQGVQGIQGEKGEQGSQGVQGIQGEQGIQGIEGVQGIQGEAGTQILTSNRNPVRDDGGKNLVWLNTATGDLFETNPVGENLYAWDKIGNLKGEAGSVIYSGTSDPVYNEIYKTSDLYFNTTSSDLFSFNKAQWVKLSNLKGDQGLRGSLWFVGSEDPVASTHYKELDSYLNNNTYDLFVFNGNNWQKSGNIKGLQGAQGEKGDGGIQGIQGEQGLTGVAGKDGVDGERGSLWFSGKGVPAASKNYKEFDCYRNELNDDIYVNNGSEWQLTGNIKGLQGEQGAQGEAGADGNAGTIQIGNVSKGDNASITNRGTENAALLDFVLPKGDKGDVGSRWYSGTQEPNASTGVKDERGAPRFGDMYLQLATQDHEAKTYIKLNNGEWSEPLGTVAGPEGKPASITIGTITTGEPGTKTIVENVGTSSDVTLNFTIPKGDKGEQGIQGEKGDQGDKGDKGESYTNDGTVDLNIKSITSDNELIKSDGKGKLAVQHFSSENGGVYSGTTDYDLGDIYYGKAPYLSFYAWKTLDNRMFYQNPTQELQYETFLSTGGLQDLTGYYSMNLLLDAILYQKWDADKGEFANIEPTRKRMTIIGTEGFLGHDTVKYQGDSNISPENPWYYGSRTLRMNPRKLNDIELNRNLGVDGITNKYMAGTVGLATNYFTKSDNDTEQDGFITPVIWDMDTDDVTQGRSLGVPYIPADKKDTLPDTTNIEVGTQSFDTNNKQPCWWDGNQWVETCINNGTADLNVKSIHSDGDKIQSDGNGNLTVGQLSSSNGYNFNYVNKETGDNCSFQTLSTSFSYSYKETGGEYSNFLINKTTTTLTQGNGNGTLSSIVISDDNVSITSIKDANKPSERKNSSFSLTPTSFTLNCNRKSVCDYSDTSNQLNMRVATWFTDKAIFNHVIELADVSSITDTDSLKAGSQAWNDSHKKPCWWDGKQWVDATGNALS